MSSEACVFLTGATGFVGKVVLAELLRRREELGVERIYLPIRDRRGKGAAQRFREEIAPKRPFQALEADWASRVVPVACDLVLSDAGMAPEDRARVQGEVTHVIHCAASIDFDLPLKAAAEANVTSALNVLAIARNCPRLRQMVDVSTAYVTPWRQQQGRADERLVELPLDPEQTYRDILADRADTAALLEATGHPNTYTLTKCLAEHMLVQDRGDVPLSIVRPSIIAASLTRPEAGWIDSPAAFAGYVALAIAGYLRVIACDPAAKVDLVPCDAVVDAILHEAFAPEAGEVRIRHAVAGPEQSPTVAQCIDTVIDHLAPLPHARPVEIRWRGPVGARFAWEEWRHHTLPLRLAALGLRLSGRADDLRKLGKLESKLRYANRGFAPFVRHAFDFHCAEPAALPGFDPDAYLRIVAAGVRRHLVRLDETAEPLAGRRHRDRFRSDLRWALKGPHGNLAIRTFGVAIRKATRRMNDVITYDHAAFARAMAQIPPGAAMVLAPTHRSYMDFLLLSYLAFSRPGLGIKIPAIAAAEEFAAIPVLGHLLTKAHAFYLRRGQGREDPALTRQVHGLVAREEVIEFFVEGARSRSRRFLRPRTGLMRCLQSTGRDVAVLPVSVCYDRVPEDAMLANELAGRAKPRMSLRALLGWARRMGRGEVRIGRIHLACGEPVWLKPDADVHEVAGRVMHELQANMAATTFHLRAFLHQAAPEGVDLAWLRAALERRGATILDSELTTEAELDPVTERSLRLQWLPWFYPDALARWPGHPVLRHEAAAWRPAPQAPGDADDPRLAALLEAAFAPMRQSASAVLDRLGAPDWAPRLETPAMALHEVPEVFLPHAEAVYECLVAEGILRRDDASRAHVWGPNARALAAFREACTPTPPGPRDGLPAMGKETK